MNTPANQCLCGNWKAERAAACKECFRASPQAAQIGYSSHSRDVKEAAARLIQIVAKGRAVK